MLGVQVLGLKTLRGALHEVLALAICPHLLSLSQGCVRPKRRLLGLAAGRVEGVDEATWAVGGFSTMVEQLAAEAEKAAAFGRIGPGQGSSPNQSSKCS